MELEFTTDQDELRDSIRAVLTKESPVSLVEPAVAVQGAAKQPVRVGALLFEVQ